MASVAGCVTKQKGDTCEAFILATLVKANLRVCVPWGDNAPYDLIVDVQGRLLRIQCKTGRLIDDGFVRFATYRIGRDTSKRGYYSALEIDYFRVWCIETGEVYFVPVQDIGHSPRPHLRVNLPRPGSTGGRQTSRVRWAGQYAAAAVIESWVRTGGNFDPTWSPPNVVATGAWHPTRWLDHARKKELGQPLPL